MNFSYTLASDFKDPLTGKDEYMLRLYLDPMDGNPAIMEIPGGLGTTDLKSLETIGNLWAAGRLPFELLPYNVGIEKNGRTAYAKVELPHPRYGFKKSVKELAAKCAAATSKSAA